MFEYRRSDGRLLGPGTAEVMLSGHLKVAFEVLLTAQQQDHTVARTDVLVAALQPATKNKRCAADTIRKLRTKLTEAFRLDELEMGVCIETIRNSGYRLHLEVRELTREQGSGAAAVPSAPLLWLPQETPRLARGFGVAATAQFEQLFRKQREHRQVSSRAQSSPPSPSPESTLAAGLGVVQEQRDRDTIARYVQKYGLSVVCSQLLAGAAVIIAFLQAFWGLSFTVDYSAHHCGAFVADLRRAGALAGKQKPDICVLPSRAAGVLMGTGESGYQRLAVPMPPCEHRIVFPAASWQPGRRPFDLSGDYYVGRLDLPPALNPALDHLQRFMEVKGIAAVPKAGGPGPLSEQVLAAGPQARAVLCETHWRGLQLESDSGLRVYSGTDFFTSVEVLRSTQVPQEVACALARLICGACKDALIDVSAVVEPGMRQVHRQLTGTNPVEPAWGNA